MLAIHLLTAMDNLGYELAACIDMSIGVGDEGMDSELVYRAVVGAPKPRSADKKTVDSWFFASKLQ